MRETADLKKLVHDAVNGNHKAFEELYHLTENTAYQAAFRILKNEDDVQDVLQNAYLKASENLTDLLDPEKFESWIKSIVENECKNYIKKEKRISAPIIFIKQKTDLHSEEWNTPIPQEYMEREELRKSVSQVLDKLSPETRACIVLFHFEDKSLEQISEILEIPLGTVKSRLHNGRKQIEKEFNKLRKKDPTLYGVAAIPAIISLFAYNAANSTVPATVSQVVLSSAVGSASAGAATAATAGASTAVAGVTAAATGTAAATTGATVASIAVKVAAVAIAGSVITGGSVAVKNYVETKKEPETTSVYSSALTTEAEETLTVSQTTAAENLTETEISDFLETLFSTSKTKPSSTAQKSTTATPATVSTTEAAASASTTVTKATTTEKTTAITTEKQTTVTTTASPSATEEQEVTFTTKRITTTEATTNPEENYGTSGGVITQYSGNESSVSIPSKIESDTVTAIGAGAFAGNTSIRSVSIPASVTQIGQEAFAECTSLSSVSLPSSLEQIGIGAFYGCTGLTSLSLPDGTQTIGDEAFANCSSMKTIAIPASVTSVADDAFNGCDSLTIKCKEGSAAHYFAVANSINCSLI